MHTSAITIRYGHLLEAHFPGHTVLAHAEVVHEDDSDWDCDFDAFVIRTHTDHYLLFKTDHGHPQVVPNPHAYIAEQMARTPALDHLRTRERKTYNTNRLRDWKQVAAALEGTPDLADA